MQYSREPNWQQISRRPLLTVPEQERLDECCWQSIVMTGRYPKVVLPSGAEVEICGMQDSYVVVQDVGEEDEGNVRYVDMRLVNVRSCSIAFAIHAQLLRAVTITPVVTHEKEG